jgi:tRNA(Ile)-lysidine synthetase-like protein
MCSPVEFLSDWINHPEWWFNSNFSYDEMITEKYGHLLDYEVQDDDDELTKTGLVICFDQVPRHAMRKHSDGHVVDWFLYKSIEILDSVDVTKYHGRHLCCMLLPFRHAGIETFKCLELVWDKLKNDASDASIEIYKQFLKATYKRMNIESESNKRVTFYKHACDDDTVYDFKKWQNILEHVCENGVVNDDDDCIKNNALHNAFETYASTLKHRQQCVCLIISLSGGVDSMICSLLAKHVWKADKIVCVHVNYANRETSNEEEKFVRDWCAHLKLPLYVRRINEINRLDCMKYDMREVYETYTRCVRMSVYKKAIADQECEGIVIMGHNKDDCFENILTNIASKVKYDNLEGMQLECECEGICFARPLLGIEKKDIIKLAHVCGVPYLYDSTPKWSQRGKIRDIVMPCIKDWHEDAIDGFFHMSARMREMWQIVNMGMHAWGEMHMLRRSDGMVSFMCTRYELPCDIIFWKTLLNLHIKAKSMMHLVGEITRWKNNTVPGNTKGKIILKVHLSKTSHLYILGFGDSNLVVIASL